MKCRYSSPYRPLDISYAERASADAGACVRWVYTEEAIGPWTPERAYTFDGPLPERFVSQWSLVLLPSEEGAP